MVAMMSVDFQTCFILGLFSVLCYSLFLRQRKDSRLGFDQPPSPPSLPIIGHLHHILSLLIHKSFLKLSSKYGPILHLHIFYIPVILVSSASVAYEIFKAQDENLSCRLSPANEGCLFFGPSGFITATYGDYWKFMKKLLVTKLLGPQALQRLRDARADELQQFYSSLLDKAMKKESVGICVEAMKLTNNSMCKILMGKISKEDSESVRTSVAETDALTKKLFLAYIFRWPLKMLGISLFKKEFMRVSSSFDEVLERKLVEHQEKVLEDRDTDLMDVLLEAYGDESAEYNITRDHIKSLLVDLLIAGSDSTAHTIEWTMAEIINNRNTFKRLREEIDSVVGTTRLIQETDIPNLPYLQAVVKEGLRLHPASPLLIRFFKEKCKIRELYASEKATLVVNVYAIMRDAEYWEDPEEFKPERFLASSGCRQEDKVREEILNYIPFGTGRRACPGENLARLFIATAIGVMVQCFDWTTKEERVNMDEAPGAITLTMAHPLRCLPLARTINPFPSFS